MRGQIYDIAGKRFFTFGGAKSHDIGDGILEKDDPHLTRKIRRLKKRNASFRINHVSWWQEEMPSEAEMEEGRKNLEAAGWEVDLIITHCCAASLMEEAAGGLCGSDRLTEFFSEIRAKCSYGHWYFGHYHVDEEWGEKETCLYQNIVELTDQDPLFFLDFIYE